MDEALARLRKAEDISDLRGILINGCDENGNYAEDEADYARGLLEAILANRYEFH